MNKFKVICDTCIFAEKYVREYPKLTISGWRTVKHLSYFCNHPKIDHYVRKLRADCGYYANRRLIENG